MQINERVIEGETGRYKIKIKLNINCCYSIKMYLHVFFFMLAISQQIHCLLIVHKKQLDYF